MTTRFVSLAVVLLLSLLSPRAATPPSANPAAEFERANKLYEQGNYTSAVAVYEALVKAGVQTPTVWFNLGNAAYKAGQIGQSIAAFRMAERHTPRDASLRANLQFVRTKVYSDERSRVPMWKNIVRLATLNEWTVLSASLLWVFFSILACGELVGTRYTRTTVAVFILFVLSGTALAGAIQDQRTEQAVVTAKEATARFGPLDESQAAFQLRDGAELTVIGTKDEWVQVRDAEKRFGWVRRDAVALLPITLTAGRGASLRGTLR